MAIPKINLHMQNANFIYLHRLTSPELELQSTLKNLTSKH